jgi:dihydroorotase
MKLQIKNGHLIDPASQPSGTDAALQRDVFIAAGRIVGVGKAPDGFTPNRVIDATGLIVAPGFIDLSARLREPGLEYKATLESEMQAALRGGVTSLVCPPDTDPVLDEPGLVEMLKFRARNLNQSRVYPLGALTVGLKGEVITEMTELTEAGCIGFGQADVPITNTQVMLRAMQYANTFGYAVWLRPQDGWLGAGGVAHSGPVAVRLGLSGVPVSAETVALHTIFELVRITGCRVHLCRMSSAAGVELLRAAKREGLPVTADVGAHHLHLSDVDIGFFNPMMRFNPPLRGTRDRDALGQAVRDGTIDVICSDHTPVDDDEKLLPFGEASAGATGLELLLSLALKWSGVGTSSIPPGGPTAAQLAALHKACMTAVERVTTAPARVLGAANLPAGSGTLTPGAPADVCLFDPNAWWRVVPGALASQGKNTPFVGVELPGKVVCTIVAGNVAYETGRT